MQEKEYLTLLEIFDELGEARYPDSWTLDMKEATFRNISPEMIKKKQIIDKQILRKVSFVKRRLIRALRGKSLRTHLTKDGENLSFVMDDNFRIFDIDVRGSWIISLDIDQCPVAYKAQIETISKDWIRMRRTEGLKKAGRPTKHNYEEIKSYIEEIIGVHGEDISYKIIVCELEKIMKGKGKDAPRRAWIHEHFATFISNKLKNI